MIKLKNKKQAKKFFKKLKELLKDRPKKMYGTRIDLCVFDDVEDSIEPYNTKQNLLPWWNLYMPKKEGT